MLGVTANSWSRKPPSRLSAAWATPSVLVKPRKPQVPLMVCIVRKIRAIASARRGILFQGKEILIRSIEALMALQQELADHLVQFGECLPLTLSPLCRHRSMLPVARKGAHGCRTHRTYPSGERGWD